jgi:hypothetical protein
MMGRGHAWPHFQVVWQSNATVNCGQDRVVSPLTEWINSQGGATGDGAGELSGGLRMSIKSVTLEAEKMDIIAT